VSASKLAERLRAGLVEARLDGFIHFQTNRAHENVTLLYLSGVGGLEDSGIVFPVDSEPVLVVKDFEESRAKKESWIRDVRGTTTIPLSLGVKALGEVVREKGLAGKRLGVDEAELTLEVYEQLRRLDVELVPFGEALMRMRMRKTTEEADKIRRAVRAAEGAVKRVESLLRDRLTEAELAAEATLAIERAGASKGFVAVQFAENAALPHARPSERKVVGDGLLVVDLGATVGGYHSDISRTFAVGSPPASQLRYVGAVWEALRQALEKVEAGANVSEVARAARRVLAEKGLPQPKHRIGHGLGLMGHEKPIVEEGFDHTLEEGNVIAVEPGVYFEGLCGARIEADVLVGGGGHEVFDEPTLRPP